MSVLVIAEAGVNHNGNIDLACKLALEAKIAGADAVKFQTFRAEALVTQDAKMADYQKNAVGPLKNQYQMLKDLELSEDEFLVLRSYCDEIGIKFCTTIFDPISASFVLEQLNLPFIKIPSGEITNLPYLEAVAATQLPLILSTGMATFDEVEAAVKIIKNTGNTNITVLHCTTEYPAPFDEVNLHAMVKMGNDLQLPFGYSDHTQGIEVSIAAVALGACVIEKHFTLDKNMEGPDHKASLEPTELAAMVQAIRNTELALGSSEKIVGPSELKNTAVVRKSIVARRPIARGEIFTTENMTTKRPGTGISPMQWHEVLGQVAKRSFAMDEMIEL